MSETMGNIIRRLRKERNLTQEELAEQLNITYQAVSRWESGTGMPDISQVVPLSNVFGVTTDVLFGKNAANGEEEIEAFIQITEKKICNIPDGVSSLARYEECCDDVQKMLEVYPCNYKLLAYSLGNICCLLNKYIHSDEMRYKTEKKQRLENECIRQANVILNYCTEGRYLDSANKWLAVLYRDMGNYAKMLEHADKITVFDPHEEGGSWKAVAYDLLGKKEESRKQNAENIGKALQYLQSELQIIGFSWEEEGKYEEAYACYRLFPDIYDLIMGGREDEIPFSTELYHELCALVCMRMGLYDEAMDWLEKMVRHKRITANNYNVITETKLPYLYGRIEKYSADSFQRADELLPVFKWRIFDPIRETDRFKAILSDAEAFEGGN